MDDNHALAAQRPSAVECPRYQCPGESKPIDRATHLARLASFYPPCRTCDRRDDVGQLFTLQADQWGEVLRRQTQSPRYTGEGLDAESANALGPERVAQFTTALATVAWRQREHSSAPPTVVVGCDGHWTTAELMSTACTAARFAGCKTLEASSLTTPALVTTAIQFEADAALWIGNATGMPHATALRAWGRKGRPMSSPGGLDAVRELDSPTLVRPRRRGGASQRVNAHAAYLASLEPQFHALRPLRFVLDTVCQPLVRDLQSLTAHGACEVLRPDASLVAARPGTEHGSDYLKRRIASLGRQVVARQAHFGIWVDGAGEACRVADETGRIVSAESLFGKLADYVVEQQPTATIVVQPRDEGLANDSTAAANVRFAQSVPTRESMFESMESSGAAMGSAAGGAVWFAGPPSVPDALLATSLLLTVLSQTDRSAGEILDAA